MILPSTLRKLVTKKALVYVHMRQATKFNGVSIPACIEYFATRAQAEHAKNEYNAIGDSDIGTEPASMEKHYFNT